MHDFPELGPLMAAGTALLFLAVTVAIAMGAIVGFYCGRHR